MAISWSIFDQIIIKYIFYESTWNGLLKNVKDGISRPLGSRENQKTKVCTVLRDTLYNKVALAKEDTFIVQTRLSLKVVGWLGKILASLAKILKKK